MKVVFFNAHPKSWTLEGRNLKKNTAKITINIDSSGVVCGSDRVLCQTGVVSCIVQRDSLDVQTAVFPHRHVLV